MGVLDTNSGDGWLKGWVDARTPPPEDKPLAPCTFVNVIETSRGYGAKVHGNTRAEVDVEFPNVFAAASYADTVEGYGWVLDIRKGDSIRNLDQSVVLTIQLAQ